MPPSKVAIADREIIGVLLSELRTVNTAMAQIVAVHDAVIALANRLDLGPDRSAEPVKKWPVFLREWRVSRGKSLDDLGKVVGLTKGQLSRVETGHQPYNQRILEGYAEVLGCRPGDLLSRAPVQPERVLEPVLQELRAARSRQKEVVSKAT